MRTTLNLSAEALANVRQLAQQRRQTLGAVASELILAALEPAGTPAVRTCAIRPATSRADGSEKSDGWTAPITVIP